MSTSKQRRQAAQRHLQRQLERRTVQVKRRRRNAIVVTTAIVALAAIGAVLLLTGVFSGKSGTAAAGSTAPSSAPASPAAAAHTTAPDGTVACSFVADKTGNKSLKDVGTPPNPNSTPAKGTATLKMTTNQGLLTLTLNRAQAPCAASSFAYLASKKFFDNTICHREVNQPTFGVLQCGDPTGTGSGGPTYSYGQEVTPTTKYPRGTIAMANSGAPNTTSSQFFLCFTDTQLSPDYTAVGTVDKAGLAVLDKIAKAGNNGSFEPSPGGGAPKMPVKITSIAVAG